MIGLFCSAIVLGAPKTVDLLVRAKVGSRYSYKLVTTMVDRSGGSVTFQAGFTETLAKIQGREMFWNTKFRVGKVSAIGNLRGTASTYRQTNGLQMTSVQNDHGELLRTILKGHSTPARGNSNVTLPGKHTKMGATWRAVIQTANVPVAIVYKLAGVETVLGHKTARIVGTYPPGSIAKAVQPTRFWVDLKTGKVVKATAVTQINSTGHQVLLSYSLSLLPK